MKDNQILNYIPIDRWSVPYWFKSKRGKTIKVEDKTEWWFEKPIYIKGLGLCNCPLDKMADNFPINATDYVKVCENCGRVCNWEKVNMSNKYMGVSGYDE